MVDDAKQAYHSGIPFRIRIGVTGHRQLSDDEELNKQIRKILNIDFFINSDFFDEDSKKILASSTHTPIAFNILTPLAEGADRLVAKEVLRLPDPQIEVVIPLPKEDYIKDFDTEESRVEFERLFSKARGPIILRKMPLDEESPEADLHELRRQAYEKVGHYVVDHCDVLIALWDGSPSRGTGGTAEIVAYAREKGCPLIIISTLCPYHISKEKGLGINARSVHGIERFNTFRVPEKALYMDTDHYLHDLFDTPEGRELPGHMKNLIKEKLLPFYVKASLIAQRNKKKYKYAGLIVYTFSALAVAAVSIGTLFQKCSLSAFGLELIFLLSILFYVFFSQKKNFHDQWIENRFLVERIRSAIFFASCGIEASPIRIPSYMGIAHQPKDWMVRVFHEIWNRLPLMKDSLNAPRELLMRFIKRAWVLDQIEYHEKNYKRLQKKNRCIERVGIVIFSAAAIAAVMHIVLCLFFHEAHLIWQEKALTLLALILPAVGASVHGLRAHREYARLEKRSKHMMIVLKELNERFRFSSEPNSLELLLREMDILMLRESQDWLMLMRFVKLETVT